MARIIRSGVGKAPSFRPESANAIRETDENSNMVELVNKTNEVQRKSINTVTGKQEQPSSLVEKGDIEKAEDGKNEKRIEGKDSVDSKPRSVTTLSSEDNAPSISKGKKGGKKKHKSPFSGLKASRVIGTALAAVTTSIVSTHFLNTINSIMVLAMTSIITTFSIELWSMTIRQTGKATAKVAEKIPYQKILPKSVATSIDEKLDSVLEETITSSEPLVKTEELDAIKQALINDPNLNIQITNDRNVEDVTLPQSDTDSSAPTEAGTMEVDEAENDENNETDSDPSVKKRVLKTLENIFALNGDSSETRLHKIMQMFLLFIIVSTLTIGGVWLGESVLGKQAITNVYQTTSLSDKDKKTILDETNAQMDQKIASSNTALNKRVTDLEAAYKNLSKTLDSVSAQLETLEKNSGKTTMNKDTSDTTNQGSTNAGQSNANIVDYSKQIEGLKSQITTLNTEIANLQSEINVLKQSQQQNTTNPNGTSS